MLSSLSGIFKDDVHPLGDCGVLVGSEGEEYP